MTKDESAEFHCTQGRWQKPYWLVISFGKAEWIAPVHLFSAGRAPAFQNFSEEAFQEMQKEQTRMPVKIVHKRRQMWWWFQNAFYFHSAEEGDP
ncbi:MAG: hypothetical protein ACR2HH_03240 [Chthoniobacterales bacterium]